KANKFHIEKALKNTVLNACESIISGGKILISTDKVKINDETSDFYVKVSVLDNGKGISKENNFKIFYPYYTDKINKDGLGLTFILAIIKENNGMVSFESKENEGTIFNLYFPLIN
ncbi:MAG: ATP-binding protein, partial [Candidatus Sericytochromatia bacterium]